LIWLERIEAEICRLESSADYLVYVDHADHFAVGKANEVSFMRLVTQSGEVLSIPLPIPRRREESAV
jgi:hypothetical protein